MSNLTERRRIVFRHADGQLYAISRNGGHKHPGFLFVPPGASLVDDNIVSTEDLAELARAALHKGCAVRCKNLTSGAQQYLKFNEDELTSYEVGPEIAEALDIPPTGSVDDKKATLSRETIEAAMDAYDSYRANGSNKSIFETFKTPKDYWVRSTRNREVRVYPTKPLIGFILRPKTLSGGWSNSSGAAARLHNAGYIIVDEDDEPKERPDQYGFLFEGAGRIRFCALNYFIEPAREKAAKEASIQASDLATAMGLKDSFPNICQVLGGEKFQKLAQVPPPKSSEPNPSSSTIFTYTLNTQPEPDAVTNATNAPVTSAVNLILYGPPGTGKTYQTAWEAVRLCLGEQVANNLKGRDQRTTLMSTYRNLVSEGRIEFVTFHQSMSYEEFIEGLRPTTGNNSLEGTEPDVGGTGFRLECHDGVFKRISEAARLDPGDDGLTQHLDRKQDIFKLSLIGPEWKEQLAEAVSSRKISWWFGRGVDWSAPEYEDFEAIEQKWLELKPESSGGTADVRGTWHFRGAIDQGSYVLLTVGKNRVVALGRVSGDYEFDVNEYRQHSRRVEWIWHDEKGAQRSAFYPPSFTSYQPLYQLTRDRIDWDALEAIVFDGGVPEEDTSARSHVLIIDEINRANISKVFGELITLLEPDKRLGMDNEIQLTLPYSKKYFGVPRNLHVIGTMNTADRSIALLDTALRRRFSFKELMPDPSVLPSDVDGVDLQKLLSTINERIEYLFDREHQIGHAYLTGCQTRSDIERVMRDRVIPLLAEYFYEDWSKVAAVLGDSAQGPSRFLDAKRIAVPGGMTEEDFSGEKLRWTVKNSFDFSEFAA